MAITVDIGRHAESVFNALGIYQGSSQDSSLSETGIKQAEKLARDVSSRRYMAIYSSPAKRAYQTAKIINQRQTPQAPIHLEYQFQEFDHGIVGGLKVEDIAMTYPEEWKQWQKYPVKFVPHFPGAEILPKEASAAVSRLKFLVSLWNDGDRILLVSHSGKIKLMILKILNCLSSYHTLIIPNCAMVTMKFTEKLPQPPERRFAKLFNVKIILGDTIYEDLI